MVVNRCGPGHPHRWCVCHISQLALHLLHQSSNRNSCDCNWIPEAEGALSKDKEKNRPCWNGIARLRTACITVRAHRDNRFRIFFGVHSYIDSWGFDHCRICVLGAARLRASDSSINSQGKSPCIFHACSCLSSPAIRNVIS